MIDISGDGANNQGRMVTVARDEALAQGITINGLPLMLKRPDGIWDIDDLDLYYRDCVIGGPGAFMIPVREKAAVRRRQSGPRSFVRLPKGPRSDSLFSRPKPKQPPTAWLGNSGDSSGAGTD